MTEHEKKGLSFDRDHGFDVVVRGKDTIILIETKSYPGDLAQVAPVLRFDPAHPHPNGSNAYLLHYAGVVRSVNRRLATEPDATLDRASRCLAVLDLLVPARIRQEEIGDALEVIHRIVAQGEPGWRKRVLTKVMSTWFWVLINAVRDLAAGIFGRKSA